MGQKEWSQYYWYHCLDLGNGIVTEGDYDLRPYLPCYGFPEHLHGMRVLDVGRANGFFSFEFERRGASIVVATELSSSQDWDRKRDIAYDRKGLSESFDRMNGGFHFAHRLFNSKVRPIAASVYDLRPTLFNDELFDLVFAGSILSHVKNPVGAIEALLSVTKGTLIVAAPTIRQDNKDEAMFFVNTADSWWILTDAALVAIIKAAGARQVSIISHFAPHNNRSNREVHHTVVHATVA